LHEIENSVVLYIIGQMTDAVNIFGQLCAPFAPRFLLSESLNRAGLRIERIWLAVKG
jgi:hypothetical protein